MAEILGKFQFMEGSWKLPENDKIQVHLDLDSSFAYEKLKAKFQELAKKAKASGQAINGMTGEPWDFPKHPVEKMTDYLAQAAAHIWGEARVSKEWDYEYNNGLSILCIEARIGNKMCRYMSKMMDGFFNGDRKAKFFQELEKMCTKIDQQMPMQYAILPKRGRLKAKSAPFEPIDFDFSFSKTSSSYEYLKSCGYLEQLDWYWDFPEKAFPERLGWEGGFYPEKNFWYKNIQEGKSIQEWLATTFASGGWLKGPQLATFSDMSDSGRLMRSICPGLKEKVKLPCGCTNEIGTEPIVTHLDRAIIHLNDFTEHNGVQKEWTREEIADWLESLDIDLSLKDTSSMKKEEW